MYLPEYLHLSKHWGHLGPGFLPEVTVGCFLGRPLIRDDEATGRCTLVDMKLLLESIGC